jgi:hypothetical protein
MNLLIDTTGRATARPQPEGCAQEEYVCWSRMQAEAGQQLDAIIARKELERRAGNGRFLWGVGNPPAVIANVFARAEVPVRAIFSVMKSRPKTVDVTPSRTVAWRRYFDAHGDERPLPPYALVTSRGDSASGAKRTHYALMCRSSEPLTIRRGEPFDPGAFRNAGGTGAPVGASQVTALLRRVGEDGAEPNYEANITAWLVASYWVRLTDPVELDASRLKLLASAVDEGLNEWCEIVAQVLSGPAAGRSEAIGTLL